MKGLLFGIIVSFVILKLFHFFFFHFRFGNIVKRNFWLSLLFKKIIIKRCLIFVHLKLHVTVSIIIIKVSVKHPTPSNNPRIPHVMIAMVSSTIELKNESRKKVKLSEFENEKKKKKKCSFSQNSYFHYLFPRLLSYILHM